MKLSGLNSCPNVPERTLSMVPGSRSTSTARGTYLFAAHTKSGQISGSARLVVLVRASRPTRRLVVVNVDSVQLQRPVPHVRPSRVDAVLIADHLPELNQSQHGEKTLVSGSPAH